MLLGRLSLVDAFLAFTSAIRQTRASADRLAVETAHAWVGVVHILSFETDVLPASPVVDFTRSGVTTRYLREEGRVDIRTDHGRISIRSFSTKAEAERWVNDTWRILINLGISC